MTARPALTRQLVVWVTSGANGTEHAVTDEQMVAGRSGVYAAQCGVQVVAASMVSPPLRRCTDCVLLLRPERARHRAGHLLGGQVVRWTRRLLGVLRLLRSQDSPYPPSGDTPILRPDGSHGGAGQHPGPAVTHHNHVEASS